MSAPQYYEEQLRSKLRARSLENVKESVKARNPNNIAASVFRHGNGGYKNHGCRCDVCLEAVRATARRAYARRKETPAEMLARVMGKEAK